MMRFFRVLIFPVLLFIGVLAIDAQSTTGSATGTVNNNNKQPESQTKKSTGGISSIDFKNFTYPMPNVGKLEKTVTLKNGSAIGKDGIPSFTLRKTYYFDLTGDRVDESISLIIANGCEMGCDSSSLFYVHTIEKDKPKLIWKIAIGGDVLGGLKSARFGIGEFVIETFDDCSIDDWLIKTNIDIKKNPTLLTSNYSRFVYAFEDVPPASAAKTLLPLEPNLNMASFRPMITFGERD